MPAILDRLVRQLQAKGYPKSRAHAIATKSLQKSGNLKKGTQKATKQGAYRGKLSDKQRDNDRKRARRTGRRLAGSPKQYRKTMKAAKRGGRRR